MTVLISTAHATGLQVITVDGVVDHAAVDEVADRLAGTVDGLSSLVDLRSLRLNDGKETASLVTLLQGAASTGELWGVVCDRLSARALLRRAGLSRQVRLFRFLTTALDAVSAPEAARDDVNAGPRSGPPARRDRTHRPPESDNETDLA